MSEMTMRAALGWSVPHDLELVVGAVLQDFPGMTATRLVARTRAAREVEARLWCYWMLRHWTRLSSTQIGVCFQRDHGSVLSGAKTVEGWIRTSAMDEARRRRISADIAAAIAASAKEAAA